MTRSIMETLLGALVLIVAGVFLVYSYQTADAGNTGGDYHVLADFSSVGGLKAGDAVLISGVKVGSVGAVDLVPDTFQARVRMDLEEGIQLPADTAAAIGSESLLGGKVLTLQPGADEEMIASGGTIEYTQAPQNLEELLGKFIFSVKEEKDKAASEEAEPKPADAMPPQPAPAVAPAQ